MSITCTIQTTVNTGGSRPVAGTQNETGSTVTEIDQNFGAASVKEVLSIAFAFADLQLVELLSSQNLTLEVGGVNEVQSLAITGAPTGGTFTATYDGQTTAAIAYNATAATVQAALEALSNIAVGDVTCAGGPLPGTPVVITFGGLLGLANLTAITTTDSLTGGSTPASAITTTTAGAAPDVTIDLKAGMPFAWGVSAGYFANPFSADVTKFSITCSTASRLQGKVLTN